MTKVYVVEDEATILRTTLSMLSDLTVEVVGSAQDVDTAFREIISRRPDLLLLDVEIGQNTSFELLEKFDELPFMVVFTTAHQKYAYEAFKFSAVDFLLKPLSSTALEAVIKKAEHVLERDTDLTINTLRHNLSSKANNQKLILRTHDKVMVVPIQSIIRCDSDLSYTIFYTETEKIVVSKTLGYYDDLLKNAGFYRVHKSHLINLAHVLRVHKGDGGEVEMTDGERVGISQRRHEDFMQLINTLGLS